MALMKSIGMESLDFQSPVFFKELTAAFAALQEEKGNAADSPIVQQLSAIIAHHTGVNALIIIDEYDPCVEIPHLDRNHPLVTSVFRNYVSSADGLALINKADGLVRGTVNLRTAKVTGIFTEVQARIHLPHTMFTKSRFDAEEIAAVTLHEVGHVFTYFEFITRTLTTNQILAGLSKALDGSGSVDEREAILMTAKDALKLKDVDVKALAKSSNKKVAEVVFITNVMRETESELGSNIFDMNSWEMLSDQFAARFGAYRPLTTALAKYYKGVYNISFRSTFGFVFMEALKLTLMFVMPGISGLLFGMDWHGASTYDRPEARFKRIRNQIVEAMKDKKLSKDDHARLEADLNAVDEVMKEVNDRRQLIEVVWNTVSPSSRKAYKQEVFQKELEDLAANDLFIKAAALRQMI